MIRSVVKILGGQLVAGAKIAGFPRACDRCIDGFGLVRHSVRRAAVSDGDRSTVGQGLCKCLHWMEASVRDRETGSGWSGRGR